MLKNALLTMIACSFFSLQGAGNYQIVVATKKDAVLEPIIELSTHLATLEKSTQSSFGENASKKITHELSLILSSCTNLILSNPAQAQLADNKSPAQLQFLLRLGALDTIENLTTDSFNNGLILPGDMTLEQLNVITQQFIVADELHRSRLFTYAKALMPLLTIAYQEEEEELEKNIDDYEEENDHEEPAKVPKKYYTALYDAIKNFLQDTLPSYLWNLISVNEVAISYGCSAVLPYLMTSVHNLSMPMGIATGISTFATIYITREHLLKKKLLKICHTAILVGAAIAYYHHFNGTCGPPADFTFNYPTR